MSEQFMPKAVASTLKTLGEDLTTWRKLRQLTARQVADRAGISISTVLRLESGKSSSLESLIRVARALGVLEELKTALDPSLPLKVGSHQTATNKNIFGAFSDSSPDRWGRKIIERREAIRAREAGVQSHSISEIEILLCVRDDVRQGALRYAGLGGAFLLQMK
jgi:transcriptional regulator with XRE-family HTH domain